MRLYPPAWAIGREVSNDCEIGGYRLERGAVVLISQWVVHRDERFWPEAMKFDPGRWLGKSDRPRYAYFPFGGGTRACIGEAFAWMEAILLLARLEQRWRAGLVFGGGMRLQPNVTSRRRAGRARQVECGGSEERS